MPLSLAYSPCPNDTFIFYALTHGCLPGSVSFAPPHLADVESLNQAALLGTYAVSKLSFHAYGHVASEYVLLQSGSALGRGCGPLLVSKAGWEGRAVGELTIAVPGKYTTAAMLLRLFAPEAVHLVEMRFDRIMPAIVAGEVEAGVIIHESRFTYPGYGLALMADLGAWWEEETGHPIPLGGIVAKRNLGEKKIQAVEAAVRASVEWAFAHRQACLPYIGEHAQELAPEVIAAHIDLYVNNFTINLGGEGQAAVAEFLRRGRAVGLFPAARA